MGTYHLALVLCRLRPLRLVMFGKIYYEFESNPFGMLVYSEKFEQARFYFGMLVYLEKLE
ncbi:hypothetical protein HanIR_Chr10g0461741 [Helianthus annuus]|nr:hypothetical protein HanIR_Chr10g0461741 [Helianthus annuus]